MLDYAAISKPLLHRMGAYKRQIDGTVAKSDQMFTGDRDHYFAVGHSAIAAIVLAMSLGGRTGARRILDLPCGHGRVLRALKAFFPDAELVACDIERDGVDFCAATFGATPVYSVPDPYRIPLEGTFDLIWVGSLLTHLDAPVIRAFLEVFAERLTDDGVLVFTTSGRRGFAFEDSLAHLSDPAQVRRDWESGFAYSDYTGSAGYGRAFIRPSWMLGELFGFTNLVLLYYRENGWADRQDAVALICKPLRFGYQEMMLS